MNKQQVTLIQIIEEAAKLQRSATIALRFGLNDYSPNENSNNHRRVIKEYTNLVAIMELFLEEQGLEGYTKEELIQMKNKKHEKIKKYRNYSKGRGILEVKPWHRGSLHYTV